MRPRAKEAPMPVSPIRNRGIRNPNQPAPPAKTSATTPRKVTRSISNAGISATGLNFDAKVEAFSDGNIFVVAGVNPEVLQLYEFADQKRLAAATDAQQSSRTSKRKRSSQDTNNEDRSPKAKQVKRASANDDEGDESGDDDAHGEAASDESHQQDYPKKPFPPPKSAIPVAVKRAPVTRRKRRGAGDSAVPSREATPPPDLLPSDEDILSDSELPSPFTDELFDDPNLPDDAAQDLYLKLYKPITKAAAFVNALTKHAPERRSTDNLYALAANTAAALKIWQDEYLQLEKITAPHAAIPRKPATGQRNPLDHVVAEDMKEADLYDYVYDAKKVGFQNPLAQKVVRDASGRELRTRQPRGQSGISTANVVSEDAAVGRRARKPVTRFDAASQSVSTRRRGQAVSETPEVEQARPVTTRRGGRAAGRGGRGRRGGGRGGLLAKRIHEMRAESVASSSAPASEVDEGEMSGSDGDRSSVPPQREDSMPAGEDDSAPNTPGPEYSPEAGDDGEGDSVALTASGKRKGRPKGSKNHHKRSDAGIPKGPRQPKSTTGTAPSGSPLPEKSEIADPEASPAPTPPPSSDPKKKAPRSEKRSQSMVEWWAKRKAKAAEEKAVQKAREQAEQAERQRAHVAAMQNAHAQAQAGHLGVLPPMHHQFPPPHSHAPPPQPHIYGGYPHPGQGGYVSPFGPPPPPPPRQGPPPGQAEYRSPFPPTGFPHAPYAMPPPLPPSSGPPPLPPGSGGAGTSLPSIGQTIGHGPWSAYPPGRQGSVYGPPPPQMQQGHPPPGHHGGAPMMGVPGGYMGGGMAGHTPAPPPMQQGPPPGAVQQQQGQQQHQQGGQGGGQQGVRDQHGFVRTF